MKEILRTSKSGIIRTLRCKNRNVIGTLANLLGAIASESADIGNIKTVHVGEMYHVRDITIIGNDEKHIKAIAAKVREVPNVEIKQIIDEVLEAHLGGKLSTQPTYPVKSIDDLRKVYTPGVASVCAKIKRDENEAAHYTCIQKSVALVTNGSRVLGLGNLGPVASMPVMEGKAALFSQLTGLNMYPILLKTRDPRKFIDTVLEISNGFGAIQLEDIESPANFAIEKELIEKLDKPVMHDDQHGTAVVTLAAVINACKLLDKNIKKLKIGQLGLGAAGQAIARLISSHTKNPIMGFDVNEAAVKHYESVGGIAAGMEEIMKECDFVVMTTGRKNLIKSEMVTKGQMILALSNPFPEITISKALRAGAAFASDGTRVNNLLGYPGIFKGALDVQAKKITAEMLIAAAKAIADASPGRELLPNVLNSDVHEKVAIAVASAAIKVGVARTVPDLDHFQTDKKT